MVSGGRGTASAAQNTPYADTLHTAFPLLPQARFLTKKWAPRAGYSKAYEEWLEDLKGLLKALGLKLDDLATPCPHINATPQIPSSASPYTPYGATEEQRERMIKWQTDSTTIYFHVKDTLLSAPRRAVCEDRQRVRGLAVELRVLHRQWQSAMSVGNG